MKGFVFALLLASLALSASAQDVEAKCMTKNPFLQGLATAKPIGVEIFETPKNGKFSKCSSEWNLYGTCCNEIELEQFYTLEAGMINRNDFVLKKSILQVQTQLKHLISDLSKEKKPNKHHLHYLSRVKTLYGYSGFSTFNRTSTLCWNQLKKIRGSALCSTCSGRSHSFFDKDKILISPADCSRTISTCATFFKSISWIVDQLHKIIALLHLYCKSSQLISRLKLEFRSITLYKPPRELMLAFSALNPNQTSDQTFDLKEAKVCSMIVNVRKLPYFLNLDPVQIDIVRRAVIPRLFKQFKKSNQKNSAEYSQMKREIHKMFLYLINQEKARHKKSLVSLNSKLKEINSKDPRAKFYELDVNRDIKQEILNHRAQLDKLKDTKKRRELIAKEDYTKKARNILREQEKLVEVQKNFFNHAESKWKKGETQAKVESRKLSEGSAELLQSSRTGIMIADSSVLVSVDDIDQIVDMVTQPFITIDNGDMGFVAVNTSLAFP